MFTSTPRIVTTSLLALLASTASLSAQDFNGNAIRDSIDLRNGVVDCNHNGVPDDADLAKPDFAAAIEHHSDSATVHNLVGLTMLDVDLDGDLDVVAASTAGPSNSNLTIWRNDGGPGLVFSTRISLLNAVCGTVRSADLNSDGRMDVVAADGGFAQVIVMLATGPGTFATPIRLTAGSRGSGLAIGDLDNDGDVDIAMPGFASNAVDVFRNNGNGTFAPRQAFACDLQPVAVAVGDFTGDGLADLAVANSYISAGPPARPGTVTLLRNAGAAAFVNHGTLTIPGHGGTSPNSRPHDVVLADTDADGDIDLLVSSKASNSLQVFSNSGTGSFTNTQTLGPLEVIGGIADRFVCTNLDADDALELAWCDSAARVVRVYDNSGGTFSLARSFAAGTEGPIGVAVGDLTGDGLPDLAAAGNTSSAFSTVVNRSGLDFDAVIHIERTDSNFYPLLADFTGDGVTDLGSYATFDNPASFRIAPGIGGGRFGPTIVVPLSIAGTIFPRDINNDGFLDLLSIGGHCFVKLSNGDGTFGPEITSIVEVLAGSRSPQTADVNNDGNLDILWVRSIASNQPHFIRISLGDGLGHFAAPYEVTTPPFLASVWTGDLTGDGFPEIFAGLSANTFGNPAFETFVVYPNNGDGTYGSYTVHAHELMVNFAGSVGGFAWADIDGDGDGDLLAQSNRTFLFRNIGNQLAAPIMLGGFANYSFNQFGPTIYDFDGDGDLDFCGAAAISGIASTAIFFNDGTGSFGAGDAGPRLALMRYRNSSDALAIGDADNNGRPDILVKPEGFTDWYMHRNAASSTTDCNSNSIPDSCDIAAGTLHDENGNGFPDECETIECLIDFNESGSADVPDIFAFLSLWFPGDPAADFDGNGTVAVPDIFAFLSAWFAGCP